MGQCTSCGAETVKVNGKVLGGEKMGGSWYECSRCGNYFGSNDPQGTFRAETLDTKLSDQNLYDQLSGARDELDRARKRNTAKR